MFRKKKKLKKKKIRKRSARGKTERAFTERSARTVKAARRVRYPLEPPLA